jgi:hypothetical protein
MTQGQGCGELPDAECDTLEEALDVAASMFGEGSVGIELPDGSWHEFGPEWNVHAKVTLLRMRRDGLNPKQAWLLQQWREAVGERIVRSLQYGAHVFQEALLWLEDALESREGDEVGMAQAVSTRLFLKSLTWGLFDIFECPTGMMPTDEQINCLVTGK